MSQTKEQLQEEVTNLTGMIQNLLLKVRSEENKGRVDFNIAGLKEEAQRVLGLEKPSFIDLRAYIKNDGSYAIELSINPNDQIALDALAKEVG